MMGSRRLHQAPHCGGGNYNRSSNQQRGATHSRTDDGTNYEQVQMDLSEEDEPSKNSVNQRQQLSPDMDRDRANRPQNRPSGHYDTNKHRDGRENRDNNPRGNERSRDRDRDQRNRSRDRNQRDGSNYKSTKEDDRDKDRDRSCGKDSRDDRAPCRGGRDDRKESRDSRGGADRDKRSNGYDRDRDNTRRDNNRDIKDKFDNRRDRDGSNNKDLDTCYNRDKRNSRDNRDNRDRGDRNRDNRDNKQRDNRRRSPMNQHYNNFRGGGNGNKRFDRVFNKMAQLEKLGIEIKTPENFVPPASGIYTLDDARGNNGPYLGNSSTSGGHQTSSGGNSMGGDGQFFMPGVTGRFRDQIERRKQLWAKSKQSEQQIPTQQPATGIIPSPQPSAASQPTGTATWAATTFAQDTDGRQANKFKRLMGIKGETTGGTSTSTSSESATPNKRQEEMFNSMEAQYEVARTATHTMRGVGLGFTSSTQGVYQR